MDDRIYNLARNEQDKKNYKKSFDLYTEGLENGDIRCAYGIALFYFEGYYTEENKNKANDIFNTYIPKIKVLAEQNDMISCCIIGYCYYNGFYLEKDEEKSISFFRKSADFGYALAQNNLGNCYYYGKGTNKDLQEAFKWYKKSAEQGNANAQNNLGFRYYNGEGTNKDLQEAFKWFMKSAEQGNALAKYNLGFRYYYGEGTNKDIKKANEMFRQSFLLFKKKGNEVDLIYFYYFGLGTKKNYKKVLQICLKNERNVDCQFILGELYYNGFGVKKDYKEAKKWYEKAAKQGDEKAFIGLGKMFYFGKENDIDYHKAIQYFEHAKLKDSSGEAYYYLGNCYYHGLGIKANWHKAKEYYERAISFGYKCEYALEMVRIDLGEFRKVTKMEQYAKELINNKFVGEALKKQISEDLQVDFENTWECLKSNAQINLITGVVTYVTFISMGEEFWAQLDFSAIIVNFAKALEIELAEYFYKGYIIYLKKKKISPSVFPEDACFIVVNKENGEEISRKYQNENEIKNFKLGGLKYIIDDKFESIPSLKIESKTNYLSKGRSETYRKFKNFKGEYGLRTIDKHMENYANDLFSQEAFGYDSKENRKKDIVNYLIDLSNAVGEIAYQYRNPAAHGDIMGMKKASACGDYLIKVRKLIYGFLSKIKNKYKDGYK